MRDPYKDLGQHLTALEEIVRRQRQINKLMQPSAIERLLQQTDHGSKAASATAGLSTTNAAIEAALGRSLGSDLVSRAAQGLSSTHYIEEQMRLLDLTRTPAFQSAIEQAARGGSVLQNYDALWLHGFVNPASQIDRLSTIAALSTPAWERHLLSDGRSWSADLAGRMESLTVDWALADAMEASASAFGRLGRLADVARFADPYADEMADTLLVDLGTPTTSPDEAETVAKREERYDEVGRDRELIAFPPTSYGKILLSAGFAASFPAPPSITITGGLIEPVQFSPETAQLLQSLEAHLRSFVQRQLEAAEGSAWLKRRVQLETRNEWTRLAGEAEAKGKPVYEPIQYANFMDLFEVIARKDNWAVFGPYFRNRENLQMSMSRIYSIRNDVAHSRPISMSDVVIAMAESTILFRAIGLGVVYDA